MKTLFPDTELEFELQELYILSKHWLHDISFIEDETRFFKNILNKYLTKRDEFDQMIMLQEANVASLKESILQYLKFLEPHINDETKAIDITLIEKYTNLQDGIKALFETVKITKSALFTCIEEILETGKNTSGIFYSG